MHRNATQHKRILLVHQNCVSIQIVVFCVLLCFHFYMLVCNMCIPMLCAFDMARKYSHHEIHMRLHTYTCAHTAAYIFVLCFKCVCVCNVYVNFNSFVFVCDTLEFSQIFLVRDGFVVVAAQIIPLNDSKFIHSMNIRVYDREAKFFWSEFIFDALFNSLLCC